MTTVSGMVISYSQGVDRLRQRTDNTPPMLIVPAVKRGARISGSRRLCAMIRFQKSSSRCPMDGRALFAVRDTSFHIIDVD
jgi:hypothetical protein